MRLVHVVMDELMWLVHVVVEELIVSFRSLDLFIMITVWLVHEFMS